MYDHPMPIVAPLRRTPLFADEGDPLAPTRSVRRATARRVSALAAALLGAMVLWCAGCGGGRSSTRGQDLTGLAPRAEYDLGCPASQITFSDLPGEAAGASGCGRRAVYVQQCDRCWAGARCRCTWILNSDTTTTAAVPQPIGSSGGSDPIPRSCGQTPNVPAQYGAITLGTQVTLGAHTPYSGPGADGAPVSADYNWAPDMQPFVGRRASVTELSGVDDAGCSVVRVDVDGGQYYWRIRDMRL